MDLTNLPLLSDKERRELLLEPSLFECPPELNLSPGEHSRLIDELFDLKVIEIEKALLLRAGQVRPEGTLSNWGASLHEGNQTWVGLAPETLQTPYSELKQICELLTPPKESRMVDLGAGYGRAGLVLNQVHPDMNFLGFEYVKERVEEGQRAFERLGISHSSLQEQDLTDENFILPEADYYFIYDYGKVSHIRNTLFQIEQMTERTNFKVIARGRGVRSIIEKEHPWLSQVHDPHHEETFSIYSMCF